MTSDLDDYQSRKELSGDAAQMCVVWFLAIALIGAVLEFAAWMVGS